MLMNAVCKTYRLVCKKMYIHYYSLAKNKQMYINLSSCLLNMQSLFGFPLGLEFISFKWASTPLPSWLKTDQNPKAWRNRKGNTMRSLIRMCRARPQIFLLTWEKNFNWNICGGWHCSLLRPLLCTFVFHLPNSSNFHSRSSRGKISRIITINRIVISSKLW